MEEVKNENSEDANGNGKGENRIRRLMIIFLVFFVIAGTIAGIAYLDIVSKRVYVEKSEISAPQINLSSKAGGILDQLFVQAGDQVAANTIVARVGNELVKAKDSGLIISRQNGIGQYFSPGQSVVAMIKSDDLRVVGRLEEDKGLDKVRVGQRVIFTVDAFGSKQYNGVIDEVSPTSRTSDVVFSISDQRQENEFNVKARFDISQYPELKNGMSAKMWIYK